MFSGWRFPRRLASQVRSDTPLRCGTFRKTAPQRSVLRKHLSGLHTQEHSTSRHPASGQNARRTGRDASTRLFDVEKSLNSARDCCCQCLRVSFEAVSRASLGARPALFLRRSCASVPSCTAPPSNPVSVSPSNALSCSWSTI